MKPSAPIFAGFLSLVARVARADPTWPAATDEMEEIVFQLQGFKGRLFNDMISPCSAETAGPGRVSASEWLRIAFHDMSTANRYVGTGGLDASIQFELSNGENTGPGHNTSLKFYANYFSGRSSMADIIAAGTYASVRQCGGPIIPLRLGRKDATSAGSLGVPQPQNSVVTFRQQFDRMGFTPAEMIQVTACGHTLGGVHSTEFPDLVPPGTGVNGQVGLDASVAAFDNKVVTEYISGSTANPLVVGPSVAVNRHSDFKVFNSDANVTMNAMAEPAAFQQVCKVVLQKMIDVVPTGVTLTDPIAPYTVKPVDMRLTLNTPGNTLLLTGYIRVRTTEIPARSIGNIILTWRDRTGGISCGSSASCSTTSTLQGVSRGFDDTFGFFPISVNIPTSAGISSFIVKITRNDGSSQTYDNNGNSYPLTDGVILQKPQSCLLQGSGALTVTALIRNDLVNLPVNLTMSYLTPRGTSNGNPVPALNTASLALAKGNCAGAYTLYSTSYTIPGGLSYNARLTVTSGSGATAFTDDFNHAGSLSGTCEAWTGTAACSDISSSVSPTASATLSTQITSSISTSSSAVTSTSSIAAPSSTSPARKPTVGGYSLVGCQTEGTGARALGGPAFAYDGMTLETCMGNCTGFDFWGTEYGRECYCGNILHGTSTAAPEGECSMLCSGDRTEYCGAGNRIELYSTTATRSTSAAPTPTGKLARKPIVGTFALVGCQTEATAGRALALAAYADDSMTLESCAAYCNAYTYFGTEYGRECYCGNSLSSGSAPAPEDDCSVICAGNVFEYCGGGNRLELYKVGAASSEITQPSTSGTLSSATTTLSTITSLAPSTTSSITVSIPSPGSVSTSTSASVSTSPSSSTVEVSQSPTGTLATTPTISPYTLIGCWSEGTGARALSAKTYASAEMTLNTCAAFCSAYKYFATEYATECFCGNAIHPTSLNTSLSECSMPCAGNALQYCGAGNRLQLYEGSAIGPPSAPSHPATIDTKWAFDGCRTEATGVRALSAKGCAGTAMTLEECALFCDGYRYFGAEYGSECYCGDGFGEGSVEVVEEQCAMACAGDVGEFCGSGDRLSVYVSS
ncbi:hypothetical protein B0T25DRAFT_621313 [Lasiosphaeria hispida]|uniref:Uncharacterized protein n=1 Tax=Lasiosphaeria hispida TaxID=260671 RepID=A0AAJ0HRA3_9PEZI|nr:hypothetical protein B0T25DRAFT_621313 [Lasiosphaeria hispida]